VKRSLALLSFLTLAALGAIVSIGSADGTPRPSTFPWGSGSWLGGAERRPGIRKHLVEAA